MRTRRGQTLALFALMLPVLIGMVGLTIDVSLLYQKHDLMDMTARAAATAGANETTWDGSRARVEPSLALSRAAAYAAGSMPDASASVEATADGVRVTLVATYQPQLLRMVGPVTLRVTRTKVPRSIL